MHQKINSLEKNSIAALPNKRFYLNIPTVILVDENTACESEAFAEAMRYNVGTILIGKSSTAGSYASVFKLCFPSGVSMKINSLVPKTMVSSGKTIENQGVPPDIWVKISEVHDLYPYNDKIRLIGRRILSH